MCGQERFLPENERMHQYDSVVTSSDIDPMSHLDEIESLRVAISDYCKMAYKLGLSTWHTICQIDGLQIDNSSIRL